MGATWPVARRHSGVGIASFVVGCVGGAMLLMLFVVAGILENATPGGMDEESAEAVLVGLFLFVFLLLQLGAAVLGLVGLFQRDRRRLFAGLGLAISVGSIVMAVFALVVGMVVS